ncbi:MAG: helix-turn-helix transcriptional regulator [Saprospiraceae bacterium]|nr:helix-turn-helix transcriptional regulator [Saprospiraceae bacterium]
MSKKINNIGTLDDLKVEFFGKAGTKKREELEEGYINFKIGNMLQEARLKKGLTQQELADRVGTTKSYISKLENSVKEARFSTLEKIIRYGFGGELELKIKMK